MTHVFLAHYFDGPSQVLYCGDDLAKGLEAVVASSCSSWIWQIWEDGKLKQDLRK